MRAELSGFSPTWLQRPVFTWAWNPSVSNFTLRRGSAASFSHCMEFFLPQAAGDRGRLATSQIPLLSASCKRQKDRPFNFCIQRPLVPVLEESSSRGPVGPAVGQGHTALQLYSHRGLSSGAGVTPRHQCQARILPFLLPDGRDARFCN